MAGISALFYPLRVVADVIGRFREHRLRRDWLGEQRQKSRKLLEKLRLSRRRRARRRDFDAAGGEQLRQNDGFRRD